MANEAPPIGQPGFNLYANQADRLRASNIAFIVIPTIFVILRLVSRKISRAGYWVRHQFSCVSRRVALILGGLISWMIFSLFSLW